MSEEEIIWWLKVLEVALIGSVKFALAPFEAERQGFGFWTSLLVTTSGGMTGILAFTFIGDLLSRGWKKVRAFFSGENRGRKKKRDKFTSGNRRIVMIKKRYGLWGLALVSPSIISIPVGTIFINHFYRKKPKNILILGISLLLWGFLLNGLAQYLELSQYLPGSTSGK